MPRIPRDPAASPETAAHNNAEQKAVLRKRLLNARRALTDSERQAWDERIGAHLLAWCEQHAVKGLGVYWPLHGEPDLHGAYAALAARGVLLYLPVVLEKHAPLAFSQWTPGEAMEKDGMGVAVPRDLRLDACPTVLLVPCLGFNASKLRLGYGGGYYDRTLASLPRPKTLGVAYSCLAAQFDGGVHDIALDDIVTEDGMV